MKRVLMKKAVSFLAVAFAGMVSTGVSAEQIQRNRYTVEYCEVVNYYKGLLDKGAPSLPARKREALAEWRKCKETIQFPGTVVSTAQEHPGIFK